ncbi:MAG: pyridoxal-phosphate dependent enzyme [Nitrososphaeria archaeon]|jgi:threonine synthase
MFKCYKCGHKQRDPGRCEVCGSATTFVPDNFSDIAGKEIADLSQEGIWRYSSLLPNFMEKITLGEGQTPLLKAYRLSKSLGVELYIKNESVNPTGSYLDRGSAIAVSYAVFAGKKEIACESNGNVGASLAAYSVRAGLSCSLYYSEIRSLGKLYQTLAYGAKAIKGKIPENVDSNVHVSGESDSYFLTGMKTLSYEIFEKARDMFDYIFMSVGEGGGISMLFAGFQDLFELYRIRIPSLVGVYLTNRSNVVDDLVTGGMHSALADFAIKVTNGFKIKVEDEEVIEAEKMLARAEGLFAEPSASVALAGLIKAVDWNLLNKGSKILYILTGTGLKDPVVIGTFLGIKDRNGSDEVITKMSDTKKAILNILYVSPAYGYYIWKKLKEFGIEKTLPDVYVALTNLQKEGLIEVKEVKKEGRTSKLYELTQKGRKFVELFLSY